MRQLVQHKLPFQSWRMTIPQTWKPSKDTRTPHPHRTCCFQLALNGDICGWGGRLYIQYLDKWVAHNSIARANRRFQTLFPFTKVTFWSVHLSHSQIAMKPARQCSTSPHRPPKAHLQPRRRPPEPCSWPWPWLLSACPCARLRAGAISGAPQGTISAKAL